MEPVIGCEAFGRQLHENRRGKAALDSKVWTQLSMDRLCSSQGAADSLGLPHVAFECTDRPLCRSPWNPCRGRVDRNIVSKVKSEERFTKVFPLSQLFLYELLNVTLRYRYGKHLNY